MRFGRPSGVAVGLGLILLLGVVARVPGLFWGYHVFGTEELVSHPDEGTSPGLGRHALALAWALRSLGLGWVLEWPEWSFLVGRLVALGYGILTIGVVFRLTRVFFADAQVALTAAIFLALADLHVTLSHVAVPNAPTTFWFYAALACAWTALERGSRGAAVLSALCAGAALALGIEFGSLLPIAVWVARSRRRTLDGLILVGAVSAAFVAMGGLDIGRPEALRLLPGLGGGGLDWTRLVVPGIYVGVLLVGVGLPVFVLAAYGLARFIGLKRAALGGWRDALRDNQLVLCLAPLGAFAQLSLQVPWAHRHALALVPFVAMLGAFGFREISRRVRGSVATPVVAHGLLAVIGIYLGLQVASVEAAFLVDPREKAGQWLRSRVPAGEHVSTFRARVPPEYPEVGEWKANYLVVAVRSQSDALLRRLIPSELADRAYFPARNVTEARRLQALVRGELPYRLIRAIRPRWYTPELLLADALGYPPPYLVEVRIYERQREREHAVTLLTPSRTDYLVTLHTGTRWRLEPGQVLQLTVNGEPLAVRLGEGLTHLLLSRTLVSSPYSHLRLASDRLLPHLPLDFVRRVRPLGREFVMESLLDGDLLPGGFSEPEIAPDGATWRWTTGAGRVLLPGPGSAGPWRRLAVRLEGRPGGASSQRVVFLLDARKLGEAAVAGEAQTVELGFPPGMAGRELSTLEIVAPTASIAGETRRVGVAVYWVRLTRAERFPPFDQPVAGMSQPRAWRPLFGLGVPYRVETVSFSSDGLTLRGDLFVPGEGGRSVVLLAHGAGVLGRKHGLYLGLARRLAERGYWVLLPDFRGYGESERPARIASAQDLDFTRDLAAAIDYVERRLGVRAVVVVGHSFGADVSIALAARDSRVAKLVAISPARRVYQRLFNRPGGTQWMRDRLAAEMGLRPEQVPVELMEPVMVPITIDTYLDHAFRQPVLLVDGEVEEEADLRFLRAVYRQLKAEKAYVTIPRADHYFGVLREVEERDPVTLDALADVVDGWIREGARWSRPRD